MERIIYKERLKSAKLYGILDMGYVAEEEMIHAAQALIDGGVDVLQLRAKDYDEAGVSRLLNEVAPALPALCRAYQVPFIVNDFPKVALEVHADGVHIGQDDGDLATVRSLVGDEMLVGRSTHSPDQAAAAVAEGFDYIGFGPLFPTPTKKGRPGIGLENIAKVNELIDSDFPVFCIGGIVSENLELVLASGAQRVVIVSALLQSEDIRNSTSLVKQTLS